MEQVCACRVRLMSDRLMRVSTLGKNTLDAFCYGHTAEAQRLWEAWLYWYHCFQLPMQVLKRRRTTGMSISEVNEIDR